MPTKGARSCHPLEENHTTWLSYKWSVQPLLRLKLFFFLWTVNPWSNLFQWNYHCGSVFLFQACRSLRPCAQRTSYALTAVSFGCGGDIKAGRWNDDLCPLAGLGRLNFMVLVRCCSPEQGSCASNPKYSLNLWSLVKAALMKLSLWFYISFPSL